MTRAVVLGAGMVGSAMAIDLASDPDFEVTVLDKRPDALERVAARAKVRTAIVNLGDPAAVRQAVGDFDLVLGALASAIGLQTLRAVIEAGRPYCDISFMAEDALSLAPLARERGVTAVVDCGVAPGVSNLMAGHAAAELAPCEKMDMYVGGLPLERRWPYQYKAGFAPSDVIEEYTRPARLVENGRIVVKEALTDPELLDFPGIGTLEAVNTDGLRSIVHTLKIPNMREKTLRYPGHYELMRVLRDTGYFSKEPLQVGGQTVRPLDVTAALLFPKWTFGPGEADVTVLRVVAEGARQGRRARYTYDLVDRYDPASDLRSMSRTTAFPATIVARMLAAKSFPVGPGVWTLESTPQLWEPLRAGLAERGVSCTLRIEPLD
jgi:saccharopine dehydrogenase-like NADP-dependent oxidoreductase